MKIILDKERKENLVIPKKVLKLSGLSKPRGVAAYALKDVLVITRRELPTLRLINVIRALSDLSDELDQELDGFCIATGRGDTAEDAYNE